MSIKIGIIGGSGLDDPVWLSNLTNENNNIEELSIDTPYGNPTSKIIKIQINDLTLFILSRHGENHKYTPSDVNYRANIFAFKELEIDYILATSAVGSLREEIKPGHIVFPNQYIDFTKNRERTFSKTGEVKHTPMSMPYDEKLRNILTNICEEKNIDYNTDVTLVTIEGPCFSTIAESHMFRQLGADIINMSGCPEVILANELNIPYQVLAMSTDYDCWKDDEDPVTWEMIEKRMKENANLVKEILASAIIKLSSEENNNSENSNSPTTKSSTQDNSTDLQIIKNSIRTIPNFPKQGIMFRDITTLLKDKIAFEKTINQFYDRYKNQNIDAVAGIEARGFIFGAILANKLKTGFIPIRKKGKLPGETLEETYDLEYGTDTVEIHKDAISKGQKILLIDDLIATGGTMQASCKLIEKAGGQIIECAFVIDLLNLGGKQKLSNWNVFSLVEFEGE